MEIKNVLNKSVLAAESRLILADRLSIYFLVLSGFLLLLYSGQDVSFLIFALSNFGLAILIWFLASIESNHLILKTARVFYPLAVIFFTHLEVELFVEILYGWEFTFDDLVKGWDAILFGFNPHLNFQKNFPERFWAEIYHLFYISYYFLLGGSILWVWLKRTADVPRFLFIYVAIFLSYVVIFSFFPAIGPLDYRAELDFHDSIMADFVDFLFLVGAPDGAAFPSSHVGLSVGIYLLLRPMKPGLNALVTIIILGIGFSMVYASIHYAIDAVAGVISGSMLYLLWNNVYFRFTGSERT